MTSPLPILPLVLAPTPTDICLSLFFDTPGAGEQVRARLDEVVGGWHEAIFTNTSQRPWMHAYHTSQPTPSFVSVHLLIFTSLVSLHTEVVQIILTSTQDIGIAWPAAAAWLRTHLGDFLQVSPPHVGPPGLRLLGHSLIYYSNTPCPTAPPPYLLTAVRAVYRDEPEAIDRAILAQQPLGLEGQLLLLDYPSVPRQGLLYLVLGQTGRTAPGFADRVFTSPDSLLVNLDVFIHKAVLEYLNLDFNYDQYNRLHLQPFKTEILELLAHINAPRRSDLLRKFSQQLATFSHTHWDISRVHYSLQQQLNGLLRRFSTHPLPNVSRLYRINLEAYLQETQAIVQQHQMVLENARLAIAMTEVQENKHASVEQRRFGQVVALGGIFFGAYTVFDSALLTTWKIISSWQYAIRFGLSVAPVLLVILGYEFVYKRYRKLQRGQLPLRYLFWPLPNQ